RQRLHIVHGDSLPRHRCGLRGHLGGRGWRAGLTRRSRPSSLRRIELQTQRRIAGRPGASSRVITVQTLRNFLAPGCSIFCQKSVLRRRSLAVTRNAFLVFRGKFLTRVVGHTSANLAAKRTTHGWSSEKRQGQSEATLRNKRTELVFLQ